MIKSRIVAIALISIILSSSSFSVVDGNTVWAQKTSKDFNFESKFYKINIIDNAAISIDNKPFGKSQPYQINLIDGVSVSISNNVYDKNRIYQIDIFDGILAALNNDHSNNVYQKFDTSFESRNIPINLSDGIQTDTTDFSNNDDRIILIKQSNDKKALWERIFPLDRIRNISKSFFKIIQNDYTASYVQLSEISINNDENSLEPAAIYRSELENLSEFEKFVGKSDYVYNQIGIHAFDLLDAEKFVGKANFVGIQLAQHVQRLADPEKFVGKSSYVSDQIAIRVQHLADPEKFVSKSMFVGHQITIQVYQVVDPKNPTLLVLLIPLVGLVLIRNENDRIKFYNIQKLVSLIFAVILISSAVITPFSYSVMYWGKVFAEEDPIGTIGPAEESVPVDVVSVEEPVADTSVLPPESIPIEEPIQLPLDVPVDTTPQEQNNIIPTRNDLTTTFDEELIFTDDTSNTSEQHIETQQTGNNQTISLDETIVLTDEITSQNISQNTPQNNSHPFPEHLSFLDDIVLLLQNQTIPSLPHSTESWQFENDTSDVTFNDDAIIDHTEGINGTSLLLDGQLDYAQANGTNATTYITDMSIAAWVKPNYTNGSPEFTVVSKGKSFVLSVNNIIEPQHVAKFSVFDGIKWTTVESYSTIPDSSWSHITARFNKTSIALYVNGTLEETVTHGGVPYVTEKGQIALKTLPEITSYYDIVIGASLSPNMESRPYNMFSGMIDGVQLFDSKLEPDDIILLYQTTIPIKSLIPVPEIRSRPEPVLRYRIIKGNETLPISIPVEDLDELNQLTVSMWIKPNFTGGSPEFTVLSRENSFVLSINKMVLPERVAKFSVYDGIMWHTVTGSMPIDGWTQVAAVINGSRILIYVNGTLDGKLETGPPKIAASTSNVIIGAYENTLRGGAEWSNIFSGTINDATIYEYSMVDQEILDEYWKNLLVYQPPYDVQKIIVSLQDSIKTDEYTSKPSDISIPDNSTETEYLSITEELLLSLNGMPIIPLQDSLVFYDNLTLTLNQEQKTPVNATVLPQTLTLTDGLYLKLNNTTYIYFEEGLLLTEDILLLLNNETVTFSNSTSRLTHGTIEIGKIVNWTQTVMLNYTDLQNILVELPADAKNIQIQKTDENGTSTEITEENLSIIEPELEPVENEYDIPHPKDINLDEIAKEYEVGNVVPLDYATLENLDEIKQKDKPTVALLINETRFDTNTTENLIPQNNTQQNQTEYTIQFQTPAPYAIETDYSTETKFQKNVTVAHDSALHYTDVKSYTDISEYLSLHNTQFKLYWMINGSKVDVTHDQRFNVTFADTDNNSAIDRMAWTIPQLSSQEFGVEADITIINVQSYPVVGGNWTVNFNTTGTADLTISGVDGTTFGNLSPDDLKFLELNDGTQTLNPIINLTANTITYYNYSSIETGFEASEVLTEGKHTLKFQFGNDIAFAHNLATDPIEVAVGRFTLNGAPGVQSISGVGFQPKAYILISTSNAADDTNSANGPDALTDISIGMTDGKNSFAMVSGADDVAQNSLVQRRGLEQYVLAHMDNNTDGRLVGAAQHERFDANGFTIAIVDDFQFPTSPLVTYIAFGGEGVTPNVGLVDLASAVAGNKKASGLGFEPDLVISSYIGDPNRGRGHSENDRNSFSLGWAINPDVQAANNQFSVMFDSYGTTTSETSTRFDTIRAGTSRDAGVNDAAFEITGFDNNGFTVTTRLAVANTAYPFNTMGFLALDLGDDPEIYTVSRTARTATGNDVANGVGFQPTFLMALGTASATITNANTDTTADADDADFFVGVTNGTYSFVNSYLDEDAVTETVVHSRTTGGANPNDTFLQALQVSGSSASVNYEADFVSFDADGWTIDYPANPADLAYQIAFLAIGDGYEFYQPPPARFMQPDAGAPGMNLQVQFLGNNFNNTQKITTNSADIVVGPTVATNEFGNNVTNNGQVLSTIFFINKTAAPQTVTVSIDGVNVIPTFKIIATTGSFVGTGDYSAKPGGTYTLGDDDGVNGNRTKGGTIILDKLIVPNGITLNINVTDIDKSTAPNEGYLPAIILVDGDVIIDGTITVSGQAGGNQADPNAGAGGVGGPGAGGGGGGGVEAGAAGNGGNGFTGGGGGAADTGNGPGGNGGNGVGSTGIPETGDEDGGIGGHTIIGNYTGGIGGQSHGNYGSGGGGGTGFTFGSGAVSGTSDSGEFSSVGSYGGGAGGSVDTDNPGGGGGFGSAGANGVGGTGEGDGGKINGNDQLVPIAGGSGGGGGGTEDDGGTDGAGGGGGGGGALLIYGNSRTFIVENDGNLWAIGGAGGNVDAAAIGVHGEGGGGSGGAIILQGISVDSSVGEIDVNGGIAPGQGGAGGDGRVRVDGLRRAATDIEGIVAFSGTKYVGPSVGFNGTHINGTSALASKVTIVVQHSTGGTNYYKFLPVNANREFSQPISFTNGAHYITVIQNTTNTNPVMSSVATHIVFKKTMKDSLSANDDITKIGKKISDIAKVDDKIKKNVTNRIKDSLFVNDVLRASITRPIFDSATVNDDIITIGMTVRDDLATIEDIIAKAPADLVMKDSATINDSIRTYVTYRIKDSATVNDDIITIGMTVRDDLATIEDIIAKAPADLVMKDSATINDSIRTYVTYRIKDSATVNDDIITIGMTVRDDLATIEDIIAKAPADLVMKDSATVNDKILVIPGKILKDSATVNDKLLATPEKILRDSVTVDDSIRTYVTYRIKDSATVNDDIITIGMTVRDDLATIEDIIAKAPADLVMKDSATINDSILTYVTYRIKDSATINDSIRTYVTYRTKDSATIIDSIRTYVTYRIKDSATVNDNLLATPEKILRDSATVNDSIRTYVTYRIKDSATVNDNLLATPEKILRDSSTVNDSIRTYVTYRIKDSVTVDDVIVTTSMKKISDSVSVDDVIRQIIMRPIHDSASVDDSISFYVTIRISDTVNIEDKITVFGTIPQTVDPDSATVDDSILIYVTFGIKDSSTIDDVIRPTTTIVLKDSATVDDNIRVVLVKTISDSITVDDTLRVTTTKVLQDSSTIDDVIRPTTTIVLKDSATVDDNIRVVLVKTISDSITVDDTLRVTTTKVLQDSSTIDDVIRPTTTIVLKDSATVDDNIRVVLVKTISDSITVDDTLRVTTTKVLQDSSTIDDVIRPTTTIVLKDSATVDDNIRVVLVKTISDSITVDDTLRVTTTKVLQDSSTIDDVIRPTTTIVLKDSATVDDNIRVVLVKTISDSITVDDTLRVTTTKVLQDSSTIDDVIRPTTTIVLKDSATVDDNIRVVLVKTISDSITVDDTLRVTTTKVLQDSSTIDDVIRPTTTIVLKDSATVDDNIRVVLVKTISDSITVDDTLRVTTTKVLQDSSTIDDVIRPTTTIVLKDSATVDDNIRVVLVKTISDSITVDDTLRATSFKPLQDSSTVDDTLKATSFKPLQDSIIVDDIIRVTFIKPLFDSVTISDTLTKHVTYRPKDTVLIDEDVLKVAFLLTTDEVLIDDIIRVTFIKPLFDSVTISDTLTKHVTYRPKDTVLIDEDVLKVAFLLTTDEVLIDDIIRVTFIKPLFDSATVDDRLRTTSFKSLLDSATVDDVIATRVIIDLKDSATVNDIIKIKLTKSIYDMTLVSDTISKQVTFVLRDSTLVEDILSKRATLVIGDEIATIEDIISIAPVTFRLLDSASVSDKILKIVTYMPQDSALSDDNIRKTVTLSIQDDLATIEDIILIAPVTFRPTDVGLVEDRIQKTVTFRISDTIDTDDTLRSTSTLIVEDAATADDMITWNLIRVFTDTASIYDTVLFTITSSIQDIVTTGDLATGTLTRVLDVDAVTIDDNIKIGIKLFSTTAFVHDSITPILTIIPLPPLPPPIPFGSGATGVGPSGGTSSLSTAKVHRVEYDVCNENIVRILATHDISSPPRIQLLTTKSGVIDATLSSNQPFANQNKLTLVDRYLFEAPLAHGESVFTIFAVDRLSNVQRTLVQIEGCQGVLVFVDDQIVLPHIFDIKYQTSSTYIRPTEYSYITQGQGMTVSAIIWSPIVPLGKADLHVSTLGTAEQTVLPMTINPLLLPDLENVSVISSIIPANLLKGPAVEFWIRIVTEEGIVQESVHNIVGIKPEGYSDESSVEMDTITIKAQGTALKPTAYLTNEGDVPVYSEVSLVADGKKVYSIPVLLTPGQNIINLEWKIPKTDAMTSYKIQTQLDVYDKSYITGMATLDTFVRTKIVPMSDQSTIVPATDELGNVIARPAMMYSSNEGSGQFSVTAPDGTCVIGAGCLVEESTLKHRGGIDSVLIDGHIYRVRYSGAENPLERFSITSLDSVLGQWKVEIIDQDSEFLASAAEDVPIKVQYRAEPSSLVTVGIERSEYIG